MPRHVLTHDQRRRRICAVCLRKGGKTITATVLKRIRGLPKRKFFDPKDSELPAGICDTCRVTLSKKTGSKKVIKSVPKLVRAKRVDPSSTECSCQWCRKTKASVIGQRSQRLEPQHAVKETEQAVPAAACLEIQESLSLSVNQTLKMATAMRKKMGRAAVEPNLRRAIADRDEKMAGLFSHVALNKKDVPACAVVCNDVSDLLRRVIHHREVDPHNHLVKVGLDGGGGMLKVTCNVISKPDSNNNGDKVACSSAPSMKETGVKRLLLLAVANDVPENYDIMSELLQHIRLQDIGGLIVAADLKMANILCGLQNPAGSCHPCPWCDLPRSMFAERSKGRPRTLGSIRRNNQRWRTDSLDQGRTQPAKAYDNCVQMPLLPGADDVLVLDVLPPMELHLLLGSVNRLVDHLEKTLTDSGSGLSLQHWISKLGLSRCSYHGGQFDGNSCKKLLNGTDLLQTMAEHAEAFCAMPVVKALRALHAVVQGCFGDALADGVTERVMAYREAYLELGIPVTVKNHAIFAHIAEFCVAQGRGLGLFSEQASESVHSDFSTVWSHYKVSAANSAYPRQLLRAVEVYNCRHM